MAQGPIVRALDVHPESQTAPDHKAQARILFNRLTMNGMQIDRQAGDAFRKGGPGGLEPVRFVGKSFHRAEEAFRGRGVVATGELSSGRENFKPTR